MIEFDLLNVIDWQRDNAASLKSIIQAEEDWYNSYVSDFWTDYQTDIFSLDTANEFGLFVWSIILNVPLYSAVGVPTDDTGRIFFGDTRNTFNYGNFGRNEPATYNLSLENRRLALKIRAVDLFTYHSTSQLNARLLSVLGDDVFYYTEDSTAMNLTASFRSETEYSQLAAYMLDYDVFPRPCGVGISEIVYRG